MDFSIYVGSIVKINLMTRSHYYEGKVLEVDERFISMIDMEGRNITITIEEIKDIREVGK